MLPITGWVFKIEGDKVVVRTKVGNFLTAPTKTILEEDKNLPYGTKIRINFNHKSNKIKNIKKMTTPIKGTVVKATCSMTTIILGEDNIEKL